MPAAAAIISAVAAAVGTGYSIYSGQKQDKLQKQAANQAKDAAHKQEMQADMELNKANQKQPDTNAILSAAQQAGQGGAGSTMLTGPGGVDPHKFQLGKNTLLGG